MLIYKINIAEKNVEMISLVGQLLGVFPDAKIAMRHDKDELVIEMDGIDDTTIARGKIDKVLETHDGDKSHKIKDLRARRNAVLEASDIPFMMAVEDLLLNITDALPPGDLPGDLPALKHIRYRRLLRDLPQDANLEDIRWPEEPT